MANSSTKREISSGHPWTVKHILHDGRDLLGDVIETHPGEKIEEVFVVLGREDKGNLGAKNDDGTYNPDWLSIQSSRALIEILHEQETEYEGAGIFENTSEPLSVEAQMSKSIENTAEIYRRTVAASVNTLSDSQLEQLETYFDKMIENRYGISMISGSLTIQD